jgi:two-component system, OmpR family, phosphate regulon sensor histidine kinase PhoR
MKNSMFDRFVLAIFICLAVLLAAQWYSLHHFIRLQRIEFNKSINNVLEKTITDNLRMRTDSISNEMYRWLMDTTLTKLYSKRNERLNTTIYYVEDVKAPQTQKMDFSLAFENRLIEPHVDSIKSIVAHHIVSIFRNQYKDYESVYYYTHTTGEKAVALSNRLRNDTLHLKETFTENLKDARLSSDFQLTFVGEDDSVRAGQYTANALPAQSLQTRLFKTGGYNKSQRTYVFATFSDPTKWLFGRLLTPVLVSVGIVLGIAAALFYLYLIIRKQKRLSQLKNDFIDNMTHELKTPLATISAAAEALQHFGVRNDEVKSDKYLTNITHQANRLNTIVNKVLDISLFDRNEVVLQKTKISVNELLREIQHTHQLVHPDVELTMQFVSSETEITGDRFHLKNVLFNLVDNAVKHSNLEKPEISITTSTENDHSSITVHDNGQGVSADHLPRIFEKFYRVPSGNIQRVKGFGLGLYYVKKIVELHEGIVYMESKIGEGTHVHIRLPLSA